MIDLSIIMVTINNKKVLEECLYSIYRSIHKISFEIILADNASTDGTPEMIKTIFPEVKLITNSENAGFVKASNQGLKNYQGRYAILLNDDTIVKDQTLDKMVEFMDQHFSAGACGPKLLNADGTLQRQGGLLGSRFWQARKPKPVNFIIGAALLVRRAVIEKIGLMDENLFFYNDDLDWCRRIRAAGWQIYYLPEVEIFHYGGYSSRRTFKPKLFIEGFRGGLYFCRKHYGEFLYHCYRFLLALSLLLFLPFQIRDKEKLFAYLEIIRIASVGDVPSPKPQQF